LGVKQGWKCAICGRSASNSTLNGQLDGLNIDHRHFSIKSQRVACSDQDFVGGKWMAEVNEFAIRVYSDTKKAAVAKARELALPKSVRGLLCPGRHGKAGHGCCNRLLGRVDNPEWLEKARNYLLDPPTKGLTV
jgi:hypothetical protein